MKDKDSKMLEEAYGDIRPGHMGDIQRKEIEDFNTTKNFVVRLQHMIHDTKSLLEDNDNVEDAIATISEIGDQINSFLMHHESGI